MDIEKLIASAAALPPFYADVCMLAADEIKALRAKLEDPDLANLRCLEGSVKNLIARLSRHDGSVLRDCIPTTGTISGDLYAIVTSAVHQQWDDVTLSDLQRRYPLPKPIDEAPARHDGGGELPSVPCEVSDGGGSAEHRGVCGSADVEPALTPEQQELCELFDSEFPDKSGLAMQIEAARPLSVKARKVTAEQFEADLLSIINAAKERNTYTADMVKAMLLHCHSAAGTLDSALEPPPSWMLDALEQARSTTRRNIAKAVQGRVTEPMPEQDIAVAIACMQAKTDAAHRVEERATYAEDQMRKARAEAFEATAALRQRESELRGTIKGRDKTIDRLCRHIAFQVAK